MGLMNNLPSFLTPPRSSKQLWKNGSNPDSPPDSPVDDSSRPARYRAPGNDGRRNSKPPSSFVMPGERIHQPPPYQNIPAPPAVNRRSSWQDGRVMSGGPTSTGGASAPDMRHSTNGLTSNPPALSNSSSHSVPLDSLEGYKTALKEWKACHTAFMDDVRDVYVPALERRFARAEPELEAALRPLCGPSELQICMKHWRQETKRLSQATMACARTMKEIVRDAWNDLVITDSPDGPAIMNILKRELDETYEEYVKTLSVSKENLWHTLDFNVEYTNLPYEVKECYWGLFDKLKVAKEERACSLPVLVLPSEMESQNGAPRGQQAPNGYH